MVLLALVREAGEVGALDTYTPLTPTLLVACGRKIIEGGWVVWRLDCVEVDCVEVGLCGGGLCGGGLCGGGLCGGGLCGDGIVRR